MDKRLIYRLAIKFLFLLLLGALATVFLKSVFLDSDNDAEKLTIAPIELDLTGMMKGDIKKTRWEGREVSILSLGNDEYFTYFNRGDSGNCPLFKEAKNLKDICTGTRFNFKGQQIQNKGQGVKLASPPHYLNGNRIFIGRWGE